MTMRKFYQNKLWRDKLPDKMAAMGSVLHNTTLNDIEFDKQLRLKLLEEADEVKNAQSTQELMHEIADLFEVLDTLCALHKLSKTEIAQIQAKKREERGGFMERKFITIAEHPKGSFGEQYCLAQPNKYPEIKE